MNERYGKYIVLDDSGEGGQSDVLKVRLKEYENIRALSVTTFKKDENVDVQWKKFKERCGRLLRLCNGNHPNIVHCYYPEKVKNEAFFEMDYINGDNLFQYLKKNKHYLPIDEVLHMVAQISDALSFCHFDTYKYSMNPDTEIDPETGESLLKPDEIDGTKLVPINDNALSKIVKKHQVIHNDISSKNIMRSNDGKYVLVDFGLSVEGKDVLDQDSIRRKEGHREYMAPERWGKGDPSPQSDIYSFGIVMYEYLTGHVPFKLKVEPFPDYSQLEKDHRDKPVPNITEMRKKAYEQKFPGKEYVREKELDWLEKIILTCLNKTPKDRYEDGKALRTVVFNNLPKDSSAFNEEELKKLKKENEELVSEVQSLRKQLTKSSKFKVCEKCGIPSFADAKFCRNCGTKFNIQ